MEIGDKVIYISDDGSFCGTLNFISETTAKVILADRYADVYIEVPLDCLRLVEKNEN
jgi:hypothetical protein